MEQSTQVGASEEQAHPAETLGPARQQDPIDRPARRLGAKRSALLERRHRQITPTRHAGVTGAGSTSSAQVLASCDGTLEFAVHRVCTGLMIEKRFWQPSGLRTAQMLLFRDVASFDRWCDLEPLRFDDPLLHGKLRRYGHDALERH